MRRASKARIDVRQRHTAFRQWKRKYDGLRPAEVYRLRRLENENRKLKIQLAKLLGTGWRLRDSTIRGGRR